MNTHASSSLRRILYWIGGTVLVAIVLALGTYYVVLPTYSKLTATHVNEKAVTPKGYEVTTIPGLVSAVGANSIIITPYAGVALPSSMTVKFTSQTVFMIPGARKDQATYQKDQATYQSALAQAEINHESTTTLQAPTIFTFTEQKTHTFSVGDMVYVHVSGSQPLSSGTVTADSVSLNESAFPAPTSVSSIILPSAQSIPLALKPFEQMGAALLALTQNGSPALFPIINFSASTINSSAGQPVTLTWSIKNATSCTSDGFDNGGSTTSGSATVYPTVTTTYTIDCFGTAGTGNVNNATAAAVLAQIDSGDAPERASSVTVSVYTPPAPVCPYFPPNGGQWQNIVANYATDGGITDHSWYLTPGQYFTGLQLKENCDDYSSENGCVDMSVQSVPPSDIFYPTNDNGSWTGFLHDLYLDLPAGQYISGLQFRSNCDYYSTEDGCMNVEISTANASTSPYRSNGGVWTGAGGYPSHPDGAGFSENALYALQPGQYISGIEYHSNCDNYSSEDDCIRIRVSTLTTNDGLCGTTDLTAGAINAGSTSLSAGGSSTYSAPISNSAYGTAKSFNSIIQIANASYSVLQSLPTNVLTLGSYASGTVTSTSAYTFASSGTYYVRACADMNTSGVGTVSESNENNNCGPWTAVNVSVPATANLTSSGLANYTVSLGQPLTVAGTISNTGNAATTGGFTNVFVTNLDSSGTYWHTLQNSSSGVVGAGASAGTSTTFPAGTFTSPGSYLYDLCANYNSSWQTTVAESNYGDNCASAGTITVVAPDITAASGAAVSGYTNQGLTFSGTVTNSGSGAASWFPNSVHICDANCAMVNKYVAASALGSLGVGASQAVSGTNTFTTPGTYYYQICGDTDTNGAQDITESNYGNNCGNWTAITVTAPSGGISASPNPCTITSGTSCTSTITWSSNASAVQVWVQQNGGTEADFANTGGTGSASAPWIGQPGNYYDFNMYDYSSGSRGARLGTVRVTAAEANLTANQGATASSIVGQAVTLSTYVVNNGNGAAGYFPNLVQVCDGNCATINSVQAATAVGSLGAGSSQYISATYTPTVNTQLYYRFCANNNTSWQNVVTETNYGDDCGNWAALNMGPAIPASPTTVNAVCSADGSHVNLSWTPMSGATTYYPRMYVPTASQCTSYGWQVWTGDNMTCLPNPDGTTATAANNFPITPGQNYTAWVHSANSSGINPTPTYLNFTCNGAADLTANTPSATSGTASTNLGFNGTVTNTGTAATTGGFWNILQICNDTNCSAYNTLNQGWVNTLGANASSGVVANATLPSNAGNYVYRWCANYNTSWQNIVPESNYGNNCGGWGTLTVAAAIPPTVSCTPSSSSVKTGDSVTFTANPSSTATGPYAWTDSDGTTGTGSTFTRTYTTPGTYSMQVKGSNTPTGYCTPSQVQVAASYCTTGTPTLSISASPVRVQTGAASTITWSGTNIQGQGASCTITGPGITQTQGAGTAPSCSIAGGSQSVNISTQSTYCIVCGSSKQCTTVNVVPKFNEF